MHRPQTENLAHLMVEWTARSLSLLSAAALLLFFIAEFRWPRIAKEWIGLALFPAGILLGFAVAWWKEGLGGSITTVSLLAFYLIYGWLLDGLIMGWAFIILASPGVLFLVSSLLAPSHWDATHKHWHLMSKPGFTHDWHGGLRPRFR